VGPRIRSEHAGQVIGRAVNDLSWSRKRGVYKAIFIAGNESFGQGPVNYRAAVRSAKSAGIYVNTIFCGSHQRGIAASWKDGAVIGVSRSVQSRRLAGEITVNMGKTSLSDLV